MSKIKIIGVSVSVAIFLVGLGVYLYPSYIEYKFDKSVNRRIERFVEEAEKIEPLPEGDDKKPDGTKPTDDEPGEKENEGSDVYYNLYLAMVEYNENLYRSGQSGLVDQLSYQTPDFKLSDYGIDNGEMFGFIEIPKIGVKLPILNGANYRNMIDGAAYLAQTSLPVGGRNTNCVIAAHNMWNGIFMFMRITELSAGDVIYIRNFWETLEYEVCEMRIIDPNESDNIKIQAGRNMVTLSTCYPSPVNNQRYLVFAEQKITSP